MKLKYIIIEDNAGAMRNLRTALRKFDNMVEAGSANNAKDGIRLALKKLPHIVFLDVELGDDNGFSVLEEVRKSLGDTPCFIMTTDFSKYAKAAVNQDVLYFLDKPIEPDELALAINKAEKQITAQQNIIRIKNSEGYFLIEPGSIQYMVARSNCCTILRNNLPAITVSRTLKDLEGQLPDSFVRIHNSYIVNKQYIHKINTSKKKIELITHENGETKFADLPIGNAYLNDVKIKLLVG